MTNDRGLWQWLLFMRAALAYQIPIPFFLPVFVMLAALITVRRMLFRFADKDI